MPSGPQRYAEAARTFEELLLQDGGYAEAATQLEACQALLQVRPPPSQPLTPCLLSCCGPHASPLSPHSSVAALGVSPCPPSCSRLRSRCFSLVRDRGGWSGGTSGLSLCPQWVLNPFGPSAAGWGTKSCQDTSDTSVTGGSSRTPTRDSERRPAVASGHPTLPPNHPARYRCLVVWEGAQNGALLALVTPRWLLAGTASHSGWAMSPPRSMRRCCVVPLAGE